MRVGGTKLEPAWFQEWVEWDGDVARLKDDAPAKIKAEWKTYTSRSDAIRVTTKE